jgi:tetratricopeptide (TPR) repeat protein
VEHPELSETGSINDIKKRLLLWAKRSPKGLARIEFSSEFSRQKVLEEMRESGIILHEIVLPSQQEAIVVVEKLLEELNQIESGLVSVTGFSTAFTNKVPLEESIRVLNFHRDRLVSPNLNQIWWMTPAFLQTSIHAMPDINSWFSLRSQLTEMILNELDPSRYLPISPDGTYSNIDDARRRVHNMLQRFQQAQLAGMSDLDLLITYLLPALEILSKVNAQKELRDLTLQFEGLLGQLKLTNSPEMATSIDHLAGLYHSQGRYSDAELLYLRALKIRSQQFGENHSSVAAIINTLAGLYYSQGRYSEAEAIYLQSLNIMEQQLGTEHPNVATLLNNLSALYDVQGQYNEATALSLRSLNILEKQLGANHPSVANSLNNLAVIYANMGQFTKAESLLIKALELRKKVLGEEHPDTIRTQKSLVNVQANIK